MYGTGVERHDGVARSVGGNGLLGRGMGTQHRRIIFQDGLGDRVGRGLGHILPGDREVEQADRLLIGRLLLVVALGNGCLGEFRHFPADDGDLVGCPGEEVDRLLGVQLREDRHGHAGAEAEGIDQPVVELVAHVGTLTVAHRDLHPERFEDQRKVGARGAGLGSGSDRLAVELPEAGDARFPGCHALQRRVVHREQRTDVLVLPALGPRGGSPDCLRGDAERGHAQTDLAFLDHDDVLVGALRLLYRHLQAGLVGQQRGDDLAIDFIGAADRCNAEDEAL